MKQSPDGGDVLVDWVNLDGHVVLRGPAVDEQGYDRAETNAAVYYGADETVRARDVLGYTKAGEVASRSGDFSLRIGAQGDDGP